MEAQACKGYNCLTCKASYYFCIAFLCISISFASDFKKSGYSKLLFESYIQMSTQEQENDISRFAFYQAGKCVVQTLLLNSEGTRSVALGKKTKVVLRFGVEKLLDLQSKALDGVAQGYQSKALDRKTSLSKNEVYPKPKILEGSTETERKPLPLQLPIKEWQTNSNYLSFIESRINFETELIGLYAGKASELFVSISNSNALRAYKNKNWCEPSLSKNKVGCTKPEVIQNRRLSKTGGFERGTKAKLWIAKLRYSNALQSKALYGLQTPYNGVCTNFLEAQGYQSKALDRKTKLSKNEVYPKTKVLEGSTGSSVKLPALQALSFSPHNTCKTKEEKIAKSYNTNVLPPWQTKSAYSFLWQSDVGLSERIKAISLVNYIVSNGSIYSKNFSNLQKSTLLGNLNKIEIKDKKVFDLFQNLEKQMTNIYLQQIQSTVQNKLLTKPSFVQRTSGTVKPLLAKTSPYLREGAFTVLDKKEKRSMVPGSSFGQTFQANNANNLFKSKKIDVISQKREISALCEEIVCQSLTYFRKPYGHWFRIYLPQIETHQRQPISKDQFYKKNLEVDLIERIKIEALSIRKEIVTQTPLLPKTSVVQNRSFWKNCNALQSKALYGEKFCTGINGMQRSTFLQEASPVRTGFVEHSKEGAQTCVYVWSKKLGYDVCHTLIMNSFYRTFNLLGENRELLDILADHLIRFGKIRTPEISRICSLYVRTIK